MTLVTYDVSDLGMSGSHGWVDPDRPPGPLPTIQYMETCIARVQTDPTLHRALRHERGLYRKIASRFAIGYDPERRAWVLPVLNPDGFLVNVIWRPHRGETMRWKGHEVSKPRRIAGRTAARGLLSLYPYTPQKANSALLLVGGEWDALAGRMHRLPAITGLLGCRWHTAWDSTVVGRRVAVCYDVGEEHEAEVTAHRLLKAGARHAWPVYLPLPTNGDDLELWFRPRQHGGYGRGRPELLELIREARAK
jgi:hypothetical protein